MNKAAVQPVSLCLNSMPRFWFPARVLVSLVLRTAVHPTSFSARLTQLLWTVPRLLDIAHLCAGSSQVRIRTGQSLGSYEVISMPCCLETDPSVFDVSLNSFSHGQTPQHYRIPRMSTPVRSGTRTPGSATSAGRLATSWLCMTRSTVMSLFLGKVSKSINLYFNRYLLKTCFNQKWNSNGRHMGMVDC